jgi:membrane associated rhomboid family serine protease
MRAQPVAAALIITANIATYLAERSAGDPDAFIAAFAFVPYDVANGIVLAAPSPPWPPLTILTALFIHAGTVHLASNMLFFAAVAPAVEAREGAGRFTLVYFAAGIGGALLELVVMPGSHLPVVGASGAIAGIMGAFLVRFPGARVIFGLPAAVVIGAWALFQFTSSIPLVSGAAAVPGTAYLAHAGGFAVGVLASGLFKRRL